jgi:hypothetical protein
MAGLLFLMATLAAIAFAFQNGPAFALCFFGTATKPVGYDESWLHVVWRDIST